MFFHRTARFLWALCLVVGLSMSGWGAVLIVEEGTEPNGYFIESTPVNTGDTFTTRVAPVTFDAYRFAYWKLNGVRQADHVGRAVNPIRFTVTANSTVLAVYTLSTGDADLDAILDFFEYEFYGDLSNDALSDTDADGFSLLMEYLKETHPVLKDLFVEGGISGRSTASFELRFNPDFYQTTAQSDPFGLIPGSVSFQSGTASWTLPAPPEAVDGLRFSGWYLDGVRADLPSSNQPASVTVTGEKTYSAKYVPESLDSDGDGLPDWYEWLSFSGLTHTNNSDPDGDALSIGLEKLMGLSPFLPDSFSEGGLSGRTAASFQVNLAGYYWFTLTSDPPGFLDETSTLVAPGTKTQTVDLFGTNINGYRFVGWELNGVRVMDSAGAAAGRAEVSMTRDRTAVARFMLDTLESDSDGIADWLERLYFGTLSLNTASDLDLDGVALALELLWGTHPSLTDSISEGGLSQRPTEVTDVIFEWMPDITQHPGSIDVPTGSNVTLRVVASWSGQLGYQWRKNGADILGATSPELELSNVTFSDSAKYDVAVYNPGVRILSAPAIVSVDGQTNGPFIITEPVDGRNLTLGGSVTLSVVGALGGGTWGYQWFKDGRELPTATAGSLTIAAMQPWHTGEYTVRVKKTVNTSSAEAVADSATLAIKSEDGTLWQGLLAYYRFNGNADDSSPYVIHGTLKAGVAFGPDQNSTLQGTASLKVSGAGAGIPDSPVLATACSVSIWAKLDAIKAGRILMRGDAAGFVPFALSVDVFGQPTFGSSGAGGVLVTAGDSLRVGEWNHLVGVYDRTARTLVLYVNATKVAEASGVTLPSGLLDSNLDPGWGIGNHSGLTQTAFNTPFNGSLDSARLYGRPLLPEEVSKIYVAEAAFVLPVITTQPLAAVVNEGDGHVFSVRAAGAGLTYQWYKDGSPVIGGNTSRLELFALTLERSGVYSVEVSNKAGTVASANAPLKVVPIPRLFQDVTSQVTGLSGYSSASMREVANANGSAPLYLSTDNNLLKLYSQPAPFQFSDVSAKVLPAGFKWAPGSRLLVADFDNNGAQDLVLWEPNGLRVLLNTAGTFKEAPVPAELNGRLAALQQTLLAVLAADLDGDGDLDLVFRYVAPGTAKPGRVACVYNAAVRNAEGRQSWAPNAAAFTRVADVLSLSYGYGGLFATDLNLDGKVDLILGEMASTSVEERFRQRPLHLFVNQGWGVLEEMGTPLTGMADYAFAFADYQGTGRLDLLQGSSDWPWAGSYPHAYWSNESGVFEKSAGPVLERLSGDYHFALSTADFDLDGRSDAFWSALTSWSQAPLKIWRQTGPKTFQDQAAEWGLGSIDVTPGRTPGAVSITGVYARQYQSTVADFDGDGAPDLLLNYDPWEGSTQRLYRNNAVRAGANHLRIRLTGVSSARDGTGARIEVRAGANVAVRYNTGAEQSNLPFGLGSSPTADLVKVYWPSGRVSEATNVPGNQWLDVVEPAVAHFEVVRGSFTWPEAVADAAERGGRPAVLSTPELQRQGNAFQTGPDAVSLWIGLSDEILNGTFRWLDGTSAAAFANWAPAEPNDYFGVASENNVEMYADGTWNDLPGTYRLPGYLFERTGGALRITKQPESVAVNFAAPFSLSVTVQSDGKVACQWFKDGVGISGATATTLSVSNLTRSDVGTYWVVVSAAGKQLTSEKALVTMAGPPPVPTDALLAWWPLDGNAIDQGPNSIHGTLNGPTAGSDRFKRATRTLEFSGSRTATAFVDFGAADKLRAPGDSTVVVWVKFADSDTAAPQILNFGTGQFELSTSTGRGSRAFQYTVGGVPLKGKRLLEAGKWHHVAAVRKAGRGFLYVNSRLDAEGPMATAPAFGSTLNLGRSSGIYGGAFAGALDDLRIYGRALTVQEIEALGSQPDGGDLLPPVIVQEPKSLLVDVGVAAQFGVRAFGSRGALYYQWLKDGMPLPGATAAVLTLARVEPRHTGAYACVVSDGYANVTSATATLGVTGVNAGLWQGLAGHWKLDGNGFDSSGFANHATMRGTPAAAADRFGSATGAFSFGGNGAYFEVGDREAFDLHKSDATLSAWVKTSSAAESWLLSKMDPSKAGGIGIGAGAAATLSSQAVTYFKLSQAGDGYQRIGAVPTMNLIAGNVYEVSAVLPAEFVWSFGDVFEFNPASSYTPPYAGIIEAVTPSTQAKAVQLVGDHVEFRYRFKSVITAAQQRPQFAFWRGARQVVEIGNIELKNITTGELLTPPLDSATLTTQWSWDSAETVKFRTATIGAAGSPTLGARTALWGNGAAAAKRASDSVALGDNKWHLVTSVYDRKGRMTLYVDGTKRVVTDITPVDIEVVNAHPLLIGSAVGATSLTGTLDDVRWYNRALGDADVLALYRQSEVSDTDGDGLSDAYEYGWGRYELVAGAFTWAEAKAHAEARGGHLATITSEAEWQAIKTVVGPAVTDTALWLGGTDEGAEGRWRWITGEKWVFAKWGRNPGWGPEPNGATSENTLMLWTDPAHVDRSGGLIWNDSNNTVRWGYLFERGYFTDGTKWDTDGDGVSDSDEIKNGTDPTNADSGLTGTMYRFVPGSFTWSEARTDAEAKGGHLATITNAEEWLSVKAQEPLLLTTTMWLGGTYTNAASGWSWITGEPWQFTRWGNSTIGGQEPGSVVDGANLLSHAEHTYFRDRENGFVWIDNPTSDGFGYLLEIEPTVQNRYSVVEGRFTWKEAKADAERRGGHLVTVASAAEWETIRLALGDKFNLELWMGGTSEVEVGKWTWVTGEPFTFTIWGPSQPDNPVNERYLEKKASNFWEGKWNDLTNAGFGAPPYGTVGYILEVERTAADLNLAITTQPAPVTVPAIGGTASFSVAATGLAPLTYQWRKDGVAISGADQATFSLKNVTPAQIGKYTAVVGDASGKTVTSNEAELAITGVNSGIWEGLVAHYPFNGNANDESGSGLHGTVAGGSLSTDRFGKASGYTFPSVGNRIRLPLDHTRFDSDYTVSVWVNCSSLTRTNPSIFVGEGPVYPISLSLLGSGYATADQGNVYFSQRSLNRGVMGNLSLPPSLTRGAWHHVVAMRRGSTLSVFVNGVATASKAESDSPAWQTSGTFVSVGAHPTDEETVKYGGLWDGSIDDIRVYNRALSAAEVTALYDSEKALPPLITRQPVGLRMPPGSSGVLRVEASGDTPLVYQWQKDGVDISGATAQELPLNSVTEALQGSYRVRVSNGAGAVFSEAVLVEVLDPLSTVTVYVAKNGSDTTGDGTQAKPFITIGKAVKVAAGGSRILVGPGTYAERVEYSGKSLRLHSSAGAASTTLQGATGNTVVYIDAAAANSELSGFKITGGAGRPVASNFGTDYFGGGLHCATTALISDCIFEANGKGTPKVDSAAFGGAIYSVGGKLQVVNCLIFNNYAWASGGATFTESGSIELDRCTVYGNDATAFRGSQGGLAVGNGGRMLVRNSIVWGNTGSQLGAFGWPYSVGTEIEVEYSDIQAPNDGGGAQTFRNGTGNISGDPLFADVTAKNFVLRTGSPALDKAAPGLPKETDGTAADMGWRADRFGGDAVTFGSQLFTDVTDSVRLPQHELLAEIDGGQGTVTDRLVRVVDGTLQLWRVTGAFGYRDVTVGAGLPKDLLAPGFGGYYAVGDVDNNGAQDLVVWDALGLRVFQNTAGAFKAASVSSTVQNRAVELFPKARGAFTLADLDNDGDLDVVFNYEEAGENPGRIAQFTNGATLDLAGGRRVWLGTDGFSGVQDVLTFPWQKPHFSVTDSNADGLPDLVVLETNGSWPSDTHVSHKAHVYLNNPGGNGTANSAGATAAATRGANGQARYGIISGSYTFAEARADAMARGGHLLTVSSAGEWQSVLEEVILHATAEDLWLGAEYKNSRWGWVTGEAFDYNHWDGGAPGSGTVGGYFAKDSGSWKTASDGVKLGYLLEWEPAFQEVEEAGLTAASEFSNFLSIDVDGDGLLDLVNGSSDWPSQSSPKVFYGNGDGTYRQERAPFVGSDRYYHHVARVADIDLDGYMDGWWSGLHNFSDIQARLWRGLGEGAFAEVGSEWGVDVGLPSGNLGLSGYLADWDGDGDLDLVARASDGVSGRYKVYRNTAADRGNRWLRVRLVGVESPRDGTGARVTVVSGDRSETQYVGNLSSDGSPLATQPLFGLGNKASATQIVVTWPNGQLQYLNEVPAGQVVEIKQNTNVSDWLKFTEQPLGCTVATGTLVVFSATAVGSGTISYQWFKDGAALAGGTVSSYRIPATALASVGDYHVVASNGVAKAFSAVARLEVAVPPSILTQPVAVSVLAGSDAAFAVDAVGTAPLSYQWSKGPAPVAGATARTLTLKGVRAADVASYSVKVTNPAGSVTSKATALALLAPVQITKQPANVTVTEGAPIGLSVTATGSPVLKYQWYRDSSALAGGTAASFTVPKASALDAGSYSVSVSNPAGEASSTGALVVVKLVPRLRNVEENLAVKEGEAFVLTAAVTGAEPLSYVWSKGGTVVAGQTAANLSVASAALLDAGVYAVEVRNAVGVASARVATVTVQALPRIVTQPVSIDAVEGATALLRVAATGASPLGYQWYKDGVALPGQTDAMLSLGPLSESIHGGTYNVQVSNPVGRVFSGNAGVVVRDALRITTQPASAELALGARGTFSVVASGAAPLSYQWYKDGAALPPSTDDTLLVASVGKYAIGDYSVVVKDRFGNSVRSEAAALTVAGEPSTYWKGLMAHWQFSSDTRDATPFLNHGKGDNVQSVPDRFGIANSALRFSGKLNPLSKPLVSQNVSVPHADSLQPGNRYTVVVWAKPEFAGENLAEVNPFMLGKRAGTDLRDSSYAMGAGFSGGTLDRLNGGGQTGYVTGGTGTLVEGQWQMYALTFDSGSLSLYRNGAQVGAQIATSSALAPNTGPLRLGSGSGDGYQEWFGCLDDIRLYNKVLSATEVAALYTAENSPPEGAVAPAAIVVQPLGYKVPEGGQVVLRVEASGGAQLAYQWKRDGVELSGATDAAYTIAAAALSDEGSYTVVVSNSVSAVTSLPAFVDVLPAVVADRLYVSKTGNDTTGTGSSAAPYLSISKAVQAARSGFQIQVGPGIYAERVEYRGKTLVIESANGPVDTVIQAPVGNAAVFIDAAAANSQLRGFKISGGTGRSLSATATSITFIGGGVCILTSAVVQDCIIEGNGNAAGIRFKSQASFGGGVYSTGGTTQLINCLILANHASEAGGSVFVERGTCELDRCTVFGNTVGTLNAQIGGLAMRDAGRLAVRNSIVRGNTGQQLGAMPFPNNKGTSVRIEYSDIEGGAAASQVAVLNVGAGNISSDPLFVDVAARNFALRTGSPALDAAAPGLPKEADGTAADMGYRQDRFGGKTAQTQDALFTEVTRGAASGLPAHMLVALVDAGAVAKIDRLVRVVNGRETVVRLWRAAGEFAATDVTVAAGLPLDLGSGMLGVGDFDNNGAQDIVSWSAAGLRVYLSTAGVFKAQTVSTAVLAQAKALWIQNAGELEVADMNGDGLLDLVCNYTVARTARPGRIGVFLGSGTADATGRRSWGTTGGFTEFREVQAFEWAKPVLSLADVNSDGLADLLVLETEGRSPEDTGSRRPVHVYLNKWKTNTTAGAPLFQETFNHGIVGGNELSKFQVADINGDGKLDLVGGSAAEGSADAMTPQWFEGAGDGTFTARTAGFVAGSSIGHRTFSEVDADLDGVLDPAWLGADGARDLQVRLWRGKGSAALQDMTTEWGVAAGLGAGRLHLEGYFSDWDGDGAQDLVVRAWDDASTQGVYKVYRNTAVSRGAKGVRVRLEGVRSPRDGQGAVIEVTAGGRKQVQYVGNLGEGYTVVKSFGLGTAAAVDKIVVRWPSGTVQELTKFGSSPVLEIKEAVVPVDSIVLLRVPQSVVAKSRQVVSLACEAVGIGAGTLAYQWQKDGQSLVGATKSSYDIAAMSAANVGVYTVRLTFGTVTVFTPPATVEMAVAPTIVAQPQSVLLLAGQTARFSVAGGGTAPLTYQWFKAGAAIAGATNDSLTVADASVGAVGAYTVKLTNGMGSVTSAVANLALATPPGITVQPAGGSFVVGAAVMLTPAYTGTAPLSYQWYKDGASVSGGTAATLSLTPAAFTTNGVYSVTVSNAFGSVDSAAAAVQVTSVPSILEQPTAVSVVLGQPFKMQVRASLGAGQAYQWFKGTSAIAGATGAEYAVAAAQVTDAGSYFVKVTNLAGMVQSVAVTVVVNVPPLITTQPAALLLKEGSAATLNVVAQGSPPLTYQWQKNGVNIPGATTALHAIKASALTDAGLYRVNVTNAFGITQSNEVEVSLLALPRISQQPIGVSVVLDDRVSFVVAAVGGGTLSYQWRKAGVAIPGARSTIYTIPSALMTDAGSYDVVVTNEAGSVASSVAVVVVSMPPTIVTQPVDKALNPGLALSLSVSAAGTAPLTYQWSKGGQAIAGATAATYTVASAQLGNAGAYTVAVSNPVGTVTSQVATVSINEGVTITTQPANLSANPGAAATFSVGATGSVPMSYQWRKAGVAIPGATAATYTIAAAGAANVASYDVVVGNPVGTVVSAVAKLTLNEAVVITTQPVGSTVSAGSAVVLTVAAKGTDPKTYQWHKDGVALEGGTAAAYSIGSVQTANAGTYTVVVSNVVNSLTSAAAVVQLLQPAAITTQPVSVMVNPGTLASFSVTATGGGTLTYQWRKAGVNLSGGTAASYKIAAAKTTDVGTYTVVVSNALGSVTSSPAELALNTAVAIATQPVGATITAGTPYTIRVVATGTAPLVYQWFKAGVAITGATSATYALASPASGDSGIYTVKVSNMVGGVTSAAANLTVAGPPVITASPVGVQLVAGASGTLAAKVRSTMQFSYQWKKDGVALAAGSLYTGAAGTGVAGTGETPLSLGLLNASDLTTGSYTLFVTNAQGSATSTGAAVTVQFAKPKFVEATLVKAGKTFDLRNYVDQAGPSWGGVVPLNDTLRVSVLASGTVTYAWRFTTMKASPSVFAFTTQTGASLDFSLAGVNRGIGNYYCKATCGTVSTELKFVITSFAPAVAGAQVSASGAPLQIVSEPVSVSASAGGVVVLGVGVTAGKRTFAWFREGADGQSVLVSAGGTGFVRLDPLRTSDGGRYFVVITDSAGISVMSRPASVTVLSAAD